jgi:hypothetical protein
MALTAACISAPPVGDAFTDAHTHGGTYANPVVVFQLTYLPNITN